MLRKAADTLRYNKDVDDPKQVTIENKKRKVIQCGNVCGSIND